MESAELYRFFAPGLREAEGVVTLPEDQGHHARDVLRLTAGTAVVVFDGEGNWARGTLAVVTKKGVTAELKGGLQRDAEPAVDLILATAIPKGDRAQQLVEQASQLNVSRLIWMSTERGVVKWERGGGSIEKWKRWAVEAAKQCGRARVMATGEPMRLAEVFKCGLAAGAEILWLDPGEGGRGLRGRERGKKVLALVGPEGGWSAAEREILEAAVRQGKAERVRLMPTVLRIETACAAIAAILMSE